MSEPDNNRSIEIKESAVVSAIVSGDGNTIYVIQQATEQKRVEAEPQGASEIGPNPYKGLAVFINAFLNYSVTATPFQKAILPRMLVAASLGSA